MGKKWWLNKTNIKQDMNAKKNNEVKMRPNKTTKKTIKRQSQATNKMEYF